MCGEVERAEILNTLPSLSDTCLVYVLGEVERPEILNTLPSLSDTCLVCVWGEVEREEILNTPTSLSIHVVYLCVCVERSRVPQYPSKFE